MTALDAVIDYPARDMTITVQAGITLAALQGALAKEGQWLPIDVALPERATLGGAIAHNKSGPRRYGYGSLRDYVIGISFVTDDGVEVKAGGRVVKNVAGYDLMKLQIGAAGTLGVVTQVTLKVKPKPEASTAVAFGCVAESLGSVLDLLHASKSRPIAVELLNPAAWRAAGVNQPYSDPWIIAVGFEEKPATVKWQLATLRNELRSAPIRDCAEVPDPATLWSAITALQARPESRTIAKTSVLPSQLPDVVSRLTGQIVHAHALNGVIWQHDPESVLPTAVIRRSPTSAKELRSLGSETAAAWELTRTVKQTLDPDDVFNSGRLFAIV
jgi:glycolate oxidase FAD binding subunit